MHVVALSILTPTQQFTMQHVKGSSCSIGKLCGERLWKKWLILTSRRAGSGHQISKTFSCSIVLAPQFHLIPFCHVHKRQASSNGHLDYSLKAKTVEEVISDIKKKKSSAEDDLGSAGLKTVEPFPDGELSPEEDLEEDEEEEEPKWHVSYGYHMVRGKMDHGMEDYVVARKRSINGKELGLYAIFDGHSGRNVAEYLQHHLFDNILSQEDFWTDPESAVRKAYKETDKQILEKVAGSQSGSTAVTAILINKEKLIVANVGDSRGVLCKKRDIEQITVDHEPEKEKELVESKGGFVSQTPGSVPRVDGQLAMTRAFGDGKLKGHITSEPDVMVENLGADAKFFILASDGLWKVMSNEDACDCIRELNDAQEAAEELVKEALYKRSLDDISCVVVMFHH